MFLNVEQLEKQLDTEDFQELGSMAAFNVLETQFQIFITSRLYLDDEYVAMTRNYFIQYTQQVIPEFHDTLIQHLESVKKSIDERAQHKRERDSWVNERLMQTTKDKVDTSKALDASLVDKESSGTESKEQDTSSRSGNDAHADDADIKPIYDEEPIVEVQTTAEINIFAIGQQHTEQPEFNNEGEVDQNAEEFGLRWVPTGKIFTSITIKVDNKPLNGSNADITNQYECEQTLDVSACTLNLGAESGFIRAFTTIYGQDIKTFTGTMFLNVEQLEKQLDTEDFQELGSMAAFNVLETQFQIFITSRLYLDDEYVAMTRNYFIQYTQQVIPEFHDTLIQHLESVKKSIDERAQHKRERDSWVNERLMQTTKDKVDTSKALDASLVDKESSGTESKEQDTSSRSGNDAHADDADIKPIYDEEPIVEVQTTAEINIFAIGQQHTEQPEFNNEGEVDQNAEEFGLRWVPTGKIFTSITIKVDNKPLNGSNADITNQYECEQTLDVSACTLNLGAGTSFNLKKERLRVWLLKSQISHKPGLQGIFN
nr:hypothetical protein [Tanacetum cinerariifolium]